MISYYPQEVQTLLTGEWLSLPQSPLAPTLNPLLLPPVLRDMAQAVADNLSIPFDLPALLGLGVASSCACGRVRVLVRDGWEEAVQLFLLVLLDSGEGKSPAFGKMCSILFDLQYEENRHREVQIARDAAAIATLEAEKNKAVKKGQQANAEAIAMRIAEYPVTYRLRRFIQGNATPETIPDIMLENGGATSMLDDEGELFEVLAGRYQDVPSLDPWLKGYTGTTPLESMRRGRCVTVHKPAMSSLILSQPDTLSALMSNRRMSAKGFIGRFLISVPSPVTDYGNEPPIPVEISEAYRAAVLRLYEIPEQTFNLSVDALALFMAFRDEVRAKKLAEWEPLKRFEFIGKLPGTLARLAGVLHLWKDERGDISAATMREAEALLRYFIGHAMHIVGGNKRELSEKAREVLDFMVKQRMPALVESVDVAQKLNKRRAFPSINDVTFAIDELQRNGYVRRAHENTGGRPVRWVVLHPGLQQEAQREEGVL